jgi:hypothetical protein
MRRLRNGFLLALALAAALAASGGAGAAPNVRSAAERFDLTTRTGVDKYLASIGLGRAGLTVQRGARNYAGAHCPGKSWNCTKAQRVLQIATRAGANTFECSPSSDPGPNTCTIVQLVPTSPSGSNTARCVEKTDESGVTQSCSITQVNVAGNNYAYVEQEARVGTGTGQSSTQHSTVNQDNQSGKNQSFVRQTIVQSSTDSSGAVDQSQNGDQTSSVSQAAGSSDLLAGIVLTSSPLYGLSPVFSEPGQQHSHVDQSLTQGANASGATGSQNQDGSIDGFVNQTSVGPSRNLNRQSELQTESAPDGVDQTQNGPLNCCTFQGSNMKDLFNIDQHATQMATSPDAAQTEFVTGNCNSSGTCDVDEFVNQDGEHTTNNCTDTSCHIGIVCAGGECTPCTGEGCEPPCTECEPIVVPARALLVRFDALRR